MKYIAFHQQANAVTDRVLSKIKIDNENVRNEIRATEAKLFSVFETLADSNSQENQENIPPQPSANNVATGNQVQLEMLKRLSEIQKEMKYQKEDGSRKQKKRKQKDKTPNNSTKPKHKWRPDTYKYCWSCGAWNHFSKDCRNKNRALKIMQPSRT